MQYDEYKDSGIAWLGQIPEHWEVCRLKGCIEFINGYAFSSDAFTSGGEMPVVRIGDIVSGRISYEDAVMVDIYPNLNRFKVLPNDILLAMSGATVGKLGLVNEGDKGYINQRVGILRSKLYKYIYYALNTPAFMGYVYLTSEGSAQPNISTFSIRNYELPLPPLSEQESIVRYLEEHCGEVDQRIKRAKRRIELLQELKQSIITEAVTRGLDHTVPTRDSGIPWLGQIPEHWEVCRLKGCIEFINGYAFSSDAFTSGGEMPVVRIGDIVSGRISYEDAVMVDIYPNLNRFKVLPNDILLAMSGATVGKLGLVNEGDKGYINQRVGILRSKLYKYIYYALNTPAFMEYVYLTSEGSAQPNISTFSIRNYELPLPPLSEQESIVRYLEERCGEVDQRIEHAKRRVELLQELKQSIITEAVTGKIKVG